MCEPVTIATMAISIASAAVSAVGARQQAKAQQAALLSQRKQQAKEIEAKASLELGERVKQGRAERSRLRVAGGEAGLAGNSFEAQLFNSFFQEDFDAGTIGTQAGFDQKGSEARFQSGLASIPNPSALETGLQIAGAGVSGFSQGQTISARIPKSGTKLKSVPSGTINPNLAISGPVSTSSSRVA